MEIADANERHIPEIIELWQEFADFHEDKDPRYPMIENVREGYETYLRGLLHQPNDKVVVAIEDANIKGFCIGRILGSPAGFRRQRYGEIDELAVATHYRRRGIGSRLVRNVMEWFTDNDVDLIELDVVSRNPGGIAFWEQQGFRDYRQRMYIKY